MKTTIIRIKKAAVTKHGVIAFLCIFPLLYAVNANAQYGLTKLGVSALAANTTGNYNTAVGILSLYSNKTGSSNTANGANSLYSNTTGYHNTANGDGSLFSNTTGFRNTANGSSSMGSNTTGSYNTASGFYSLFLNTTGYSNTANGYNALYSNTTGYNNTASGNSALYSNKTGYYNTAYSSYSLASNTTGNSNTANGFYALYSNTTGNYNTAIGDKSLFSNTAGNYNTAIGSSANVSTNDLSNATAIGYNAKVDASNKVRIGNTLVTSIGGEVSWTTFSDGRYKKEIKENVPGLSFINSLRPVTYTVNVNGLNEYYNKGMKPLPENETNQKVDAEIEKGIPEAGKMVHSGFIAQEVEAAATKLNFTFSGVDKPQSKDGLYGLRYDNFVMPLVKAVQELSKIIDTKDDLIADQQDQLNKLQARLKKLEAQTLSSAALITTDNASALNQKAVLDQNAPNPFNSSTVIRYHIPATAANAQIMVTDASGSTVKTFVLTGKGAGNVTINANELNAGSYYYTLIVDGKRADSKQMILVK